MATLLEELMKQQIPESGRFTTSEQDAKTAASYHNVGYTAGTYPTGQSGYYIDSTKANRTTQAGTSGADEGLLNDNSYAQIQALKDEFANQQAIYKQAQASGDEAAANAAWSQMTSLHDQAESVRANYGYSGGSDGGDYIPIQTGYASNDDSSSGSGSSGSSGSALDDYSSYLEQMYAAKKAAAIAALEAAYQQNVAAFDRTAQAIPVQYQDARNLTAGLSEQEKRNFAQYAAANGLNNGTAGQAELARSITLQGNLNTINNSEASALADLELQRTQAEAEYNLAIAQAQASGDYELANALYQEKVRVQELMLAQEEAQRQYELQQYQLQYQAQQDAFSNQLALDQFAFQQKQYYDQLAAAQVAAAAKAGTTGTGNGLVGTSSGYNNGSLTIDQVKALQAALGVTQDGYFGPASQAAANERYGTTDANAAYNQKNSNELQQYVLRLASDGRNIDYIYDKLQSNGRTNAEIDAVFAALGW